MRILKFFIACAVLLSSTMVRAQDGVCTVPFDATSLADFIVDEVGLPEAVDFGIAAPLMATSPVADGTIGDGEYSNKCFFTFAENQNPGQSWPTLDNLNDGDADLTANMYFAHTEDNLFVAFEVFDDFLDQDFPANSFQNDGVELFMNPDLDTGDAWGPGKFQIYADAAGDGDIFSNNRGATAGIAPFSDPDPAPGEYYSAGLNLPGDIGYVVEFQIPLASLDKSGGDEIEPIPVETGDFILINAAIDDNDENDDLAAQTGHHVLWHFEGASSPWGGAEKTFGPYRWL
ncbi:MAG: sugar-binding protein [Pirellulaceae bacterium]